ncbi:exonuclease SbcCD subunit D [Sinomicrobium soli]|uniref:exonuclease SbcCD subunit D n=1 Tax=Sinomicrobium sp. N-1-3-6 TaxID=2219864 RepID=UPI000DCF5322|nr:exonuclease SbcCD subunit D C-terminal domain-containing protein [Sinomicrobium sp. N-1-3-6]RAV28612.1 exonuclease sbcCD subunit D [Sinomicrobium sp. N-1-3-6]
MKILHTADWHIGQLFHEYDRTCEHREFLEWLENTLQEEQVDVLLVSGDVFDLANPSAASVRLFYNFLRRATTACPDLQVIITAGNHDSASRLESPKPLLESSNIHITGIVEKKDDGTIDYDKLLIPIQGKTGKTEAWCMAVPFLRMGDYPQVPDSDNPYTDGVAALYAALYEHLLRFKQPEQPVIAMGHLHARQAEISDMDKAERLIMGGVECVSASAFHKDICYVALGHIHKAQRIGGKDHIRYSGSPLPMSFSEITYRHQVVLFDLENHTAVNIRSLEVPVSVPLKRIPPAPEKLEEVLKAISKLPDISGSDAPPPYLEVRVLLEGPEPSLRHRIETALRDKDVRLTRIDVRYTVTNTAGNDTVTNPDQLKELQPLEVLEKVYHSRYGNALPEELRELFHRVNGELPEQDGH